MEPDLLSELAKASNCDFISDLPIVAAVDLSPDSVIAIANETYSLAQWTEAANYIIHDSKVYNSVAAAKKVLCDYLVQENEKK